MVNVGVGRRRCVPVNPQDRHGHIRTWEPADFRVNRVANLEGRNRSISQSVCRATRRHDGGSFLPGNLRRPLIELRRGSHQLRPIARISTLNWPRISFRPTESCKGRPDQCPPSGTDRSPGLSGPEELGTPVKVCKGDEPEMDPIACPHVRIIQR